MANDFMANVNKVVLDGEVVSFNKTFPNVETKVENVTDKVIEETVIETKVSDEIVEDDEGVKEETTEE